MDVGERIMLSKLTIKNYKLLLKTTKKHRSVKHVKNITKCNFFLCFHTYISRLAINEYTVEIWNKSVHECECYVNLKKWAFCLKKAYEKKVKKPKIRAAVKHGKSNGF